MDILEMIKEFIKPEMLIIVPVLYLIGMAVHKSKCKNNYIPMILGLISTILVLIYLLATIDINCGKDVALLIFTAITQGILLAGASVYIDQLKKQHSELNKKTKKTKKK